MGNAEWSLSPAYDLNPVPADVKARVLTTNLDLDEGTCSLDLLESASGFFGLTLAQARPIIKEVATVIATWRDTTGPDAPSLGEPSRDERPGRDIEIYCRLELKGVANQAPK